MTRKRLVAFGRRGLRCHLDGTQDQVEAIHRVPAIDYYDPDRWQTEIERVFRRLPLVLASSSELAEPGAYHAIEVAGVPVVVMRGEDRKVRAFLNSCSHRGAMVVPEGVGQAHRHACPYHSWTYDTRGALVSIYEEEHFGEVDRSCNGLPQLPCDEQAGLIWVTLSAEPVVDIDTFLCGYGDMLAHLGFSDCHVVGRQIVEGPNWKVAYDGYLDLYHLPILHWKTLGTDGGSHAIYDSWGPHQRATRPDKYFARLEGRDEDDWENSELVGGVWTIFPHVSIAGFDANGKIYMLSQLFPGPTPDTSTTIQTFLHTRPPDDEQAVAVAEQMEFLRYVVAEDDYFTGKRLQRTLRTGMREFVQFGRNEGGGQRFHRFVDRLIATEDEDVAALFKETAEN